MVFIFNDTPGMHAAATCQTGAADETAAGGVQGEACGAPVMPMGTDPVSAVNTAALKFHTAQYGGHFATAAGHQHIYGESISQSATAYSETDSMVNTAGIAEVGVNAAQVAAGLSATRL
jgi:hypothetical protein